MLEEERLRQIEKQQRWELESVERGINRYRALVADADLADTTPGMQLMGTILNGLIPAIREAQEEAVASITTSRAGRRQPWAGPILMLEAEKLAVITARSAMSTEQRTRPSATSLANRIGTEIKQQIEFDRWKAAQNAAAEAARKAGEPWLNHYRLMLSRSKTIDSRAARRWMQKGEAYEKEDWSTATKLHIGGKLLTLLVEHGGGAFEFEMVASTRGRTRSTECQVHLTDLAKQFVASRHAESELTRPWLLPMKCPPKEWKETANAA